MRSRLLFAFALGVVALVLVWSLWPRAGTRVPSSVTHGADARAQLPQPAPERAPARSALALASATVSEDVPTPHGVFEGEVVSEGTGRGVARATLTLSRQGGTVAVVAGADGRFRFAPEADGRYELVAITADGHLPFAPEPGHSGIALETRAGSSVRGLVFRLAPRVEYVGVVRARGGEVVAGARVRALDESVDDMVTDAQGMFHFNAADGTVFEARHPDHGAGRAMLDLGALVSRRLLITLSARPDGAAVLASIEGRVVDVSGAPVEGARVTVTRGDGELSRVRTSSGLDGSFAVRSLDAGEYAVVAELPGSVSARRENVPAGSTGVLLQLLVGGALEGRVTDARSGVPLAGFSVAASRMRSALERGETLVQTFFHADGRYVLRGLADGTWAVAAMAAGHAPAVEQRVSITNASHARVDLALGAGATLTGRVTDARTSNAIEGARVSVEGGVPVGESPVAMRADARTDGDGRFTLTGLAPGLRSLMVSASGHHGRIRSGLVVGERDVGPIDIAMTPTEGDETPRIELAGIGAVLSARGDVMVIGRVVAGGGAAEAGLREGDGIVTVEGVAVTELGFEGTIQRIRGPEGSAVRLTVRRAEDAGVVEVRVMRRLIRA